MSLSLNDSAIHDEDPLCLVMKVTLPWQFHSNDHFFILQMNPIKLDLKGQTIENSPKALSGECDFQSQAYS